MRIGLLCSTIAAAASCLCSAQSPKRVVCLGDSISGAVSPPLAAELRSKFSVKTISAKSPIPSEGDLKATIKARPDFVLLSIGTDAAADPRVRSQPT